MKANHSIDMTGMRVGKWTVVGQPQYKSRTAIAWLCQCECGIMRHVGGGKLRQGATQSCGCISREDRTGKVDGDWTYIRSARDAQGAFRWVSKNVKFDGVLYMLKRPVSKLQCVSPAKDDYWKKVGECNQILKNSKVSWSLCIGFSGDVYHSQESDNYVIVPPDADISTIVDYVVPKMERSLDIVGRRVGAWTVVEKVGRNRYGQAEWKCECVNCGNLKNMNIVFLEHGTMCKKCRKKHCHSEENLVGRETESFVVLSKHLARSYKWLCKCRFCGTEKVFDTYRILGGYPACTCEEGLAHFWQDNKE
jgi:hypothetical protein